MPICQGLISNEEIILQNLLAVALVTYDMNEPFVGGRSIKCAKTCLLSILLTCLNPLPATISLASTRLIYLD